MKEKNWLPGGDAFASCWPFDPSITASNACDADDNDDDAGADWSLRTFCLIPALAIVFHVSWGKKDASAEEVKKKGQA